MPKLIKGFSIIVLLVLVVLSLVLADVFKIAVEVGYYSKRIEMQYNTWLAVGGCILAIIIATPMYILGYVLSLLGAIQKSSAKTAESISACATLLSETKELIKPEVSPTINTVPPAVAMKADDVKQTFDSYAVDKSNPEITCPNCGMVQKSDRNVCFKCGARFLDASKSLPINS